MLSYLLEQDRIKKLLNELLNPGFVDMKDPEGAAKEISAWHNKPEEIRVASLEGKRIKVRTLPHFFTGSKEEFESFNQLWQDLFPKILVSLIGGVYVHGSFGTDNYVESSDLDLVYILNKVATESPAFLMDIREDSKNTTEIFKEIDPFQHHGPYILTPKIMQNYLESYLPLAVWEQSRPIWGPRTLKFYIQDSPYHNKLWFLKSRKYYNGSISLDTEYDRKKFVCMACMIPCVAYPFVTGKYTTKKQAFRWFAAEYPKSKEWIMDIQCRRIESNYENIDGLVKATVEVLKLV